MKIFLRLLRFLWPFRWRIALAFLLGSLMVASNMLLLSLAAYLIADAAIVTLLVLLTVPITIVRFMGVSRAAARYFERLVSHDTTFRLLARLRVWTYNHLEPLAPSQFLRSGDLLARLVADVDELQNIYLRLVSPIIIAVLIALLTFDLFAIFDLRLAWVAVASLAAVGAGVPLLSRRLASGLGKRHLALRGELNAHIVDGVQGVQDLLAYGSAGAQVQKVITLDNRLAQIQHRMASIAGLQEGLNDLLTNLGLWGILILAIPLATSRAIDSVYLGFLVMLLLASFEAVQPLAQAFQSLGHSLSAGKRLFEIAEAAPVVVESASPLPLPARREHELAFEQVHFAYSTGGQSEVLHNIDLCIAPGRRVAVVGPSGAGKSTLLRLALRFWDPQQGVIRLDGQDIRNFALADLRGLMGVVTQDTYLFNTTIRGNLLLARAGASEQEMRQALEQAQLGDFIRQLPQGLNTWIGEQGLRLSGGERQRLAIARALLKDAPLLLLDEVTANLDSATERALLDALDTLMRGRTTLLVTHRLVLMERMDEILVLDQGRIVERGTHQQLLAQDGLYRRLFDIQNGIL
ncbi:MAG TPA: thiol reductant ABC exporter subunit CydC, partial [Ktedonobacteraceae bacterium]|nr:thiol reductant ABC exporter subunit CydC [Ktedonobacteraceae bacterium]